MAGAEKTLNWKVMIWVGVMDFALGLGLVFAWLTGFLGEDGMVLAVVGGMMGVTGLGIALWARSKMSEDDNRRGDLN